MAAQPGQLRLKLHLFVPELLGVLVGPLGLELLLLEGQHDLVPLVLGRGGLLLGPVQFGQVFLCFGIFALPAQESLNDNNKTNRAFTGAWHSTGRDFEPPKTQD